MSPDAEESPDIERSHRSVATVVAERRAPAARRRVTDFHRRRPVAADHGASAKSHSNLAAMFSRWT